MEMKETTSREYYRKPVEFIDGRNGFKIHGSMIMEKVNGKIIETGIIEVASRQNRAARWKVEYAFNKKTYDSLGEAIAEYEKNNSN